MLLVDLQDGSERELTGFGPEQRVSVIRFSSSGKRVAIATHEAVHVMDWPKRALLRSFELGATRALAFSPDERTLAAGGGDP